MATINWPRVSRNVVGTAAAGGALATVVANFDWVTFLGITFACIANLIGLFQKQPIERRNLE